MNPATAATRPAESVVDDVQVVDFTSLPAGWRNVYRDENDGLSVEACPGVITLHVVGYTAYWSGPRPVTRRIRFDEPEVKFVFATVVDGELTPVSDRETYVKTVGPDERVD